MSNDLRPFILEPKRLPKPWGGRSMGPAIGESWELHSGNRPADPARALPLLLKFIDAAEDLSVQVHPDDALARRLEGPAACGKSEMWVLLAAAPGAKIYSGFKPGVDAAAFEAALKDGSVTGLLNAVPVRAGDAFDIPAGRVHAIGAGCVLAEVQQDSDLTYRVWDHGRLVDGKPRELHLAQARQALRFDQPFAASDGRLRPSASEEAWGLRESLLQGPYFTVERWRLSAVARLEPLAGPVACMVLQGSLGGVGAGHSLCLPAGQALQLEPGPQGALALWVRA